MNNFGPQSMEKTIKETLENEEFPYAHFAKIIKDKSKGTINQDEAARMAIKLFKWKAPDATQEIAREIMRRINSNNRKTA